MVSLALVAGCLKIEKKEVKKTVKFGFRVACQKELSSKILLSNFTANFSFGIRANTIYEQKNFSTKTTTKVNSNFSTEPQTLCVCVCVTE